MSERHDIVLRPAEDGPNPPDLLRQIVEDVRKLVPEAGTTARKWMRAKGDESLARAKEIQARVYKEIAELDIERQRMIQQRDEVLQRAELDRFRQKTEALREVVDCIVKLRELGITINLKLIRKVEKAAANLLDE